MSESKKHNLSYFMQTKILLQQQSLKNLGNNIKNMNES